MLQLGLSFVPTPAYNSFQTRVDVFKLICNIKLKNVFGISESESTYGFRPKSTYVLYINDPHIQTFENVLLGDIKNLKEQQRKPFF